MKQAAPSRKRGPFHEIMRSVRSNKVTVACLIFIALLILIAIFADVLFDYQADIVTQNAAERLQGMSWKHIFGTDAFGRDYFARTLYATRVTLVIALSATALGTFLALVIGSAAAYCGGMVDAVIMRIVDILISIPTTLVCICIVAVLGGTVPNLILALAFCIMPKLSRIVRAQIMTSMENEYVEAARACGAGGLRIIVSHLIPNSLGPIIVSATMDISACILSTAGLGYLGMGVPAPAPEWGAMLSDAQEFMRKYMYLIMVPGLAICLSSIAFNLLGDGIQDAMDPRLRGFRRMNKKRLRRARAQQAPLFTGKKN